MLKVKLNCIKSISISLWLEIIFLSLFSFVIASPVLATPPALKLEKLTNMSSFFQDLNIGEYVEINGEIFFTLYMSYLYKSDDSAARGASPVSTEFTYPKYFTLIGQYLYFSAQDDTGDAELWRLNITTFNAFKIDLNPSGSSAPADLFVFNGLLYFSATNENGRGLWTLGSAADGSAARVLKDISPSPSGFLVVGELFYFVASVAGGATELWLSDGTSNGTVHAPYDANGRLDFSSGYSGQTGPPVEVDGDVYFYTNIYTGNSGYQTELWKTDGNSTIFVTNAPNSKATGIIASGDKVYINYTGLLNLFAWDTAKETGSIISGRDGEGVRYVREWIDVKGTLFFTTSKAGASYSAYSLWSTRGSSSSTVKLIEDSSTRVNQGESLSGLNKLNESLYLTNWQSMLQTTPNDHDIEVITPSGLSKIRSLQVINGKLYFYATNESNVSDVYVLKPLHAYFDFSYISEQEMGAPFQVTLTARNQYGSIDTTFHGRINLRTNTGDDISPSYVYISPGSDGTITFPVRIDEVSDDLSINAVHFVNGSEGELAGNSSPFNVTSVSPQEPFLLNGRIVNGDWLPIEGLEVHLCDCALIPATYCEGEIINYGLSSCADSTFTEANGYFEFTGTNHYGKKLLAVQVAAQPIRFKTVRFKAGDASNEKTWRIDSAKQPVLLIPGIMGSTSINKSSIFPGMPKMPALPSELQVHDSFGATGFYDLKSHLSANYTVYMTPWDWRLSVETAWEDLKIMIDKAKRETGFDKVHVVAHSMGGLLTRAYIQNDNYDNDVDKFIMVGTPNFGSPKAYVIIEGGDPRQADRWDGEKGAFDFYCRTIRKVYKQMEGVTPFKNGYAIAGWSPLHCGKRKNGVSAEDLRKWLRGDKSGVKGPKELLPVYNLALQPNTLDLLDQAEIKNLNPTLLALNADANVSRMTTWTDSSDPNDVRTVWLFSTSNKRTPSKILATEDRHVNDGIYSLAEPKISYEISQDISKPGIDFIPQDGDGTVPPIKNMRGMLFDGNGLYELDVFESGSEITVKLVDGGEHAFMMGKLKQEIGCFLDDSGCSGGGGSWALPSAKQANLQSTVSAAAVEAEDTQFSLHVDGSAQPLITDPSGNRTGKIVNPVGSVEEIPGSTSNLWPDSSSIDLVNPQNGLYSLHLSSNKNNKLVEVTVNLGGGEVSGYGEFEVIIHPEGYSVDIEVDTSSENALIVNASISSPQNIYVDDSAGYTNICWDSLSDANLQGYRIYGRPDYDHRLEVLADVDTDQNCYLLNHVLFDGSNTRWLYSVVAFSDSNVESLVYDVVANKDLDADNDSVIDINDAFPADADEWEDTDGDTIGNNADDDDDGDNIADVIDNCSLVANADQINSDDDIFGDACDEDDDNDLVFDYLDNCVLKYNPLQKDSDDDGFGDRCDQDAGDDICFPVKTSVGYMAIICL